MLDKTIKCRICGKPYVFYSMMADDQSACPECVAEARRAALRPSSPAEMERRRRYFGGTWAREE